MGMIFYVILSCCFCWIWLWNWLVFELSVCDGHKLLCFRYLWTHVVITMWTPMYEVLVNYLWNGCRRGLLCWITTILVVCKLVWNPSWFQLTTGFIWVQVWWFDHSGDCFRTCALINWSVLLHISHLLYEFDHVLLNWHGIHCHSSWILLPLLPSFLPLGGICRVLVQTRSNQCWRGLEWIAQKQSHHELEMPLNWEVAMFKPSLSMHFTSLASSFDSM